jgi:hypothetical protein
MERTHFGDGSHGPDCFGCKILSVGIAPSAMPSRHPHAARVRVSDKKLEQDLQAFKVARQGGMSLKAIDGAHDLMQRAESTFEAEKGQTAVEMAKSTKAYKSGDAAAHVDVSRGAKEYRKRAEETHTALKRGETIEV